MIDIGKLADPFPEEAVHWRVQGKAFQRDGKHYAMALAYLDARDVMDRLDAVCGPERWQSLFDETPKGRVICRLMIDVTGGGAWVTKSDGAGDTDVEGEKGGISDALKRAAVSWGIGRYLYRLSSPWVACEVNDKGAWKKWAEDPWQRVKGKPAPRSEPPTPAEQPRDPVKIADGIIAAFAKAGTVADLDAAKKDGTKVAAAWDWLEKNHEAQAQRVTAACQKRYDTLSKPNADLDGDNLQY